MTAPSYNLSKYVGQIIQKSINSPYNIKNSFSFCEFINEVKLPPNHILISLDVKSLFTSIPLTLIQHDIIMRWDNIQPHTNINLDLFLELVNFCAGSSYFVYEGKYYEQVFGTAMDNPLSPTVADLVMESLLDTVMRKLDFTPPFMKKYVDDLVTAIPPEKLQHILDTFNSYEPHIQFTHELEVDNKLPFLDMLLVRKDDQTVKTEWYMKPIASGRFLDFLSYHPMSMKINVAKNFIDRVHRLSTNLSIEQQSTIINDQLRLNHYPPHLRHRLINRITERPLPSTTTDQNTTDDQQQSIAPCEESPQQLLEYTYRSLLHIPHLSSRIERQLKKEYPNIRLANRNINTINKTFSKIKDPLPPGHQTNVIYQIPCKDCHASYIGMTTNTLNTRMYGHKTHYNTLDRLQQTTTASPDPKIVELAEKTALLKHSIENNHRFDLGKVKIIDRHDKQHALPILEMCHIKNSQHCINKRTDTEGLNVVYAGILHAMKNNTNISTTDNTQTTTETL